jgi:putrescine aminotransferase
MMGRLGGLNTHHPINLAYLAAMLREEPFDVQIWDYEVEPYSDRDFVDRLRGTDPLVVGFTLQTPYYYRIRSLTRLVRMAAPKATIVAGGPHASAVPVETLRDHPDIDIVVRGDGEETLCDLCHRLVNEEALQGTRGIAFRDSDRQIQLEAPRAPPPDLDALPLPARDLLPLHRYGNTLALRRAASPGISRPGLRGTQIFLARGCFSHCTFCAHTVVSDHGAKRPRQIRYRGSESIEEEVRFCVTRLGINHFSVEDDVFPLNENQLEYVCWIFERWGVEWNANTRVERAKPKWLARMRKAGCVKIDLGVESGSPRILKLLQKGITIEEVEAAFRNAREAGLLTTAYFMVGSHPSESNQDIDHSWRLVKRIRPDFITFSIAAPYPGTQLRHQLEERGFLGDEDFETYCYYDTIPSWRVEHFSGEELAREQRRFLRRFYLRPRYLGEQLLRAALRRNSNFRYILGAGLTSMRFLAAGSPANGRRSMSLDRTLPSAKGAHVDSERGKATVAPAPGLSSGLLGCEGARALDVAETAELYDERHLGGLMRVTALLGADVDVVDGDGAWLVLADGSRLLDCHASNGAVAFGHKHPSLLQAAHSALEKMSVGLPGLLPSRGVAAVCHDLVSIAPAGLSRAILYNSGAESVEGALTLASRVQGRRNIFVGFDGGFHGKTAGARAVGGIRNERRGFPALGITEILPYGNLLAVNAFFEREGQRVAAVVVEPIQSNSGIRVPPDGFLTGLREACQKAGALLVIDEISTGLGRTGELFACQSEGVVPDLICVSKTLSGGIVPIGAVLVHERLSKTMASPREASHFSTTFAGGELATAVALEVLRLLVHERLPDHAKEIGRQLEDGLGKLRTRYPRMVRGVRGRGLMWALEFADPLDLPARFLPRGFSESLANRAGGSLAIAFQRYVLKEQGVLLAPTAGDRRVVRMFPPLIAEPAHIDLLLGALDGALAAGLSRWARALA